jgi:lipoprotein-anchoring transpeptidase ErfK/SrfK
MEDTKMKQISSRPEAGSRARWQARFYAVAVTVVLAATEAFAQEQAEATKAQKAQAAEVEPTREVVVSIPDRKLALIEDGEVVKVYAVAVGKKSTPSPTGDFTVRTRVTNPTYYHKGQVIPTGAANPVGTRWIGLSQKGYGIHGTNEPRSIGKAASHGCIRMAKADLEELFEILRPGDKVSIRGERDEEVAQMFGGEPVVMAAAQVKSEELPHSSKGSLNGAPVAADAPTVIASLQLGPANATVATSATGGR